MKNMLVLGAAVLGFTFLGQAEAKADNCGPRVVVAVRGGYPVYAPAYYGSYGYYHRPHYVRHARTYRRYQPRAAYAHGY
ncbi:hypothetical protein AYO41_05060 [Verrucomicrobia bacterium SCGC AG-212-E04]|nr:hypothetical protein AYO41_05060 [Verrucomicrobia bacterium SCGC AG-212-E04]